MNILCLETSSKNCSVAIAKDQELLCLCEEVSEQYKHSEDLHKFVKWALEGAEISLKDIDIIALGKGPGSYTGLRIGAAAAKGFCFGLQRPLVSVDSLDSLAEPYYNSTYDYIIPMMDARRMEVYCKIFDSKGQEVSKTQAKILDENSFSDYQEHRVLFVGDGAKKAKEILKLPQATYEAACYPSAKYLIPKAYKAAKANQVEDVAYFEPLYLKPFQGTKKKS